MRIISEIDFNRNDDRKEFGSDDKVLRICRFKQDGKHYIGFSFELGRKNDDTLSLTVELGELLTVIATCEEEE